MSIHVPTETAAEYTIKTRNAGGSRRPIGGVSHVAGRTDIPLLDQTIPAVFADAVVKFGPREAAVFPDSGLRLTWHELDRKVDALAAGLLALGLEKGDRLGIWSPNRLEWLVTQFATARIGVILVTINPAYRTSELEYALAKSGCKALVLASRFKTSDYLAMLRELLPELETCRPGALKAARLPSLRSVVHLAEAPQAGMFSFEEVLGFGGPVQHMQLDTITHGLLPDDPINIQFTSGTTGAPKGATLTHRNILNNARFVTAAIELTEDDRLCIPVPLYHCFGMVMGTLGCVTKGAAMIFPGEGFEPGQVLAAVETERATALYGVPTMFVTMLDHPTFASRDLSTLRTGIMAGAPCPIEVMKRVIGDMHMRDVTIAYGMTETSPVSFQSAVDDPLEKRVSTVGRVHPHVEVKVVAEDGSTVPAGAVGELWTRGYSVMSGYWDEPEKTAESIADGGWMRTGDLATIDADGYCNIVGRLKDMIIRGGENIYPREIEEFLYRHPDVAQVQVFGIPSKRYGEEVVAWIVPHPGHSVSEAAIQDFCRGQIAHYKVPSHVRLVESLPMTVTGKPQKFLMREAMMAELGLEAERTA